MENEIIEGNDEGNREEGSEEIRAGDWEVEIEVGRK